MSVNPVGPGGLRSYGPLSGNLSQTSRAGRFATGPTPHVSPVGPDTASVDSDLQTQLDATLRRDAAARPSNGDSGTAAGRPSAAIALYQRVNQIGQEESSPSQLLQRWNSIVQQETNGDAGFQTYSHPGGSRFDSGILDLTA